MRSSTLEFMLAMLLCLVCCGCPTPNISDDDDDSDETTEQQAEPQGSTADHAPVVDTPAENPEDKEHPPVVFEEEKKEGKLPPPAEKLDPPQEQASNPAPEQPQEQPAPEQPQEPEPDGPKPLTEDEFKKLQEDLREEMRTTSSQMLNAITQKIEELKISKEAPVAEQPQEEVVPPEPAASAAPAVEAKDDRPLMIVYSEMTEDEIKKCIKNPKLVPKCPPCVDQYKAQSDPGMAQFRYSHRPLPEWTGDSPTLSWRDKDGTWRMSPGWPGTQQFMAIYYDSMVRPAEKPMGYSAAKNAERWRAALPRRVQYQAHTDLAKGALELPRTALNIAEKSIDFVSEIDSSLNRWFSVHFSPGHVHYEDGLLKFSAPPELRFHLTQGGQGSRMDVLNAIGFEEGGVELHLSRLGKIHFKGSVSGSQLSQKCSEWKTPAPLLMGVPFYVNGENTSPNHLMYDNHPFHRKYTKQELLPYWNDPDALNRIHGYAHTGVVHNRNQQFSEPPRGRRRR